MVAALVVAPSVLPRPTGAQEPVDEPLESFDAREAAVASAMADRIWPATTDGPGATEIGAVRYIDHALATAYASQRSDYRQGLAAIDALAHARYDSGFVDLTAVQQEALLRDVEIGQVEPAEAAVPADRLRSFFAAFRRHTMEGLFSDPIYLGNRDFAGWRAVGYPGAQFVYSESEQQSNEPIDMPPRSVGDY